MKPLEKRTKKELLEYIEGLQENQAVVDYHNFSHIETSKEKRAELFIGDIYINGAECLECGYFVRSRNKHDMVRCKCGAVAVDGGSHYCKRSGDLNKMREVIVMYDDVSDDI